MKTLEGNTYTKVIAQFLHDVVVHLQWKFVNASGDFRTPPVTFYCEKSDRESSDAFVNTAPR